MDFVNQVVCSDCLQAMAKMPSGAVNLIYIDPPFGDNAVDKQLGLYWNATEKHLRWFDEYFGQCVQNIKKKRQHAHYLYFMHERLVLMRDLLAEDGSIYVHCGWRVQPHLRQILDEIFGADRFLCQIVWKRSSIRKAASKKWLSVDDMLLLSTKSAKYVFNTIYLPYSEEYKKRFNQEDSHGKFYWIDIGTYSQERLESLKREGRVRFPENPNANPRIKHYLHEGKGVQPDNVWTDIAPINSQAIEATGYATQKPEALLERIIKASSNKGDLVADFFCGSGTTLAVAAKLGRRYFGCDINPEAVSLALARLARDREQRAQTALGI